MTTPQKPYIIIGLDQAYANTGVVIGTPQGDLLAEFLVKTDATPKIGSPVTEQLIRAFEVVRQIHKVVKLPTNYKMLEMPVSTARMLVGGKGWGNSSKDMFHHHLTKDLQLYNHSSKDVIDAWTNYEAGRHWVNGDNPGSLPPFPLDPPDALIIIEGLAYRAGKGGSASVTGAAILAAVIRLHYAGVLDTRSDDALWQYLSMIPKPPPKPKAKPKRKTKTKKSRSKK